jgi:hypothetical protein
VNPASLSSSDAGKLRVFVSYSRDDLDFADQLNAALDACGFECLVDRHDISAGEDWEQRLANLISEADTVVFALSSSSARSERCAWEVEEAQRLNKRILPIVCRPLEGAILPPRLRELNYIFFYSEPRVSGSGWGTGLASLIPALNTDRKTSPQARVFISYRREDSKWPARQMYEAFLRHVPKKQVFMDIDSIAPGADFAEILQNQVTQCEIVLALIGPGWAGNTDPSTGQRRLDNPKDFVRIEICAALSRAIRIVPVLLDDAPMPNGEQLPEDMRTLVGRQAEFVGYRTFDADVDRLIRRIGFGLARMQ